MTLASKIGLGIAALGTAVADVHCPWRERASDHTDLRVIK
jgi:hypothetical protein